jgi:uncharacterized RDD family membrane protein YckC
MTKMETDPYTPPHAEITPQTGLNPGSNRGYVLASRTSRLVATLIDNMTTSLTAVGLLMYTGNLNVLFMVSQNQMREMAFLAILSLVLFLLINGVFLFQSGQSLGKMIMGIRIVSLDPSTTLPIHPILIRYSFITFLSLIPYIGGFLLMFNFMMIFSKSRQCLHDRIAKTLVVSA